MVPVQPASEHTEVLGQRFEAVVRPGDLRPGQDAPSLQLTCLIGETRALLTILRVGEPV